jgi:hypothetical protein
MIFARVLLSPYMNKTYTRIALFIGLALLVPAVSMAATTISTDISTGGTLSVTGASALTGGLTLGSALTVANGGTGLSALAAGYVPFGAATSAFATSSLLFWDNTNGRLSLGTSSPTNALTIVGDTVTSRELEIHNNFAVGEVLYSHSDTGFRAPTITLYKSKGSQLAPTAVANGNQLGYLQVGGYNGSGYVRGGIIQFNSEENWTTSTNAANIAFYTNPSGSSDNPLERMRITSTGTVGIGVTAPTASLEVATSTSNATTTVSIGTSGQNKGSCLVMYDATGAVKYVSIQAGALVVSSTSCR